jgi:pimeloyl-ACP methyl ester carboxylesterase
MTVDVNYGRRIAIVRSCVSVWMWMLLTLSVLMALPQVSLSATPKDRPLNLALGEVPDTDAEVRRGYADSFLGQIHFQRVTPREKKATDTLYVLLHQVPWSHIYYARAQAELARAGIESIAFDTPGYGLSAKPANPPAIAQYARAIFEALRREHAGPVVLVGHHTGATLSVEIARQHPEAVERLVLHGLPLYTTAEAEARLSAPHWDQTLKQDGSHLSDRWLVLSNRVAGSAESLHWSVVSLFLAGEQEWFGHHAVFRYPMAESLQALRVPATVLSNADDLLDFTLERVKEIRPDWHYRRLQGSSSNMAFDEPRVWVQAVLTHGKD